MTEPPLQQGDDRSSGHVAHGALRGVVAAMAMTGVRAFTINIGLVDEPPPRAILRQKSRWRFHVSDKRNRRAFQELMHWGYGAVGGAGFAALPAGVRRQPWFGPLYGVGVWLGFEAVQAPLLGLKQAKALRPLERVTLAVDHLVYGFVLSETRRLPR